MNKTTWSKKDAFLYWDCLHEVLEMQGGFFDPNIDIEETACMAEQITAIEKRFTR